MKKYFVLFILCFVLCGCNKQDSIQDNSNEQYLINKEPLSSDKDASDDICVTDTPHSVNQEADINDGVLSDGKYSNIKVGNTIEFGCYEQDDDEIDGKEPIEWIVISLDANEGTAMLLSKYVLDTKPFNEEKEEISWKKCSLRKWLNIDFYNEAFGEDEKTKIIEKLNDNEENPDYGTDCGTSTKDKVFILSLQEAINTQYGFNNSKTIIDDGICYLDGNNENSEQYFLARTCKPTLSATMQESKLTILTQEIYELGSSTGDPRFRESDVGNCPWWLRTMGENALTVSFVNFNGTVHSKGVDLDVGAEGILASIGVGVRPVIIINIK